MEKNNALQLMRSAEQLQRLGTNREVLPLMSYFKAPVSNVLPLKDLSVEEVCELIGTDFLKSWTAKVRDNRSLKSKVLPYVTPCGTFKRRNVDQMLSYSGMMVIDIDYCDIDLKKELASDPFLKPVLIFVSPSGVGLKLFIRIRQARIENHLNYFNALSWYLLKVHQVVIDKSGSDLPRACFLCHDPEVYYSSQGYVESADLLNILPQIPAEKSYMKGSKVNFTKVYDTPLSLGKEAVNHVPAGDRPSDQLNRIFQVHALAEQAVNEEGWQWNPRNRELLTRPGKNLRDGCSAKWNVNPADGLYYFTCFSSNGGRLKPKGYTDVQLVCELLYNGNWQKCITELAHEYLQ